jgi:hypothetical protein
MRLYLFLFLLLASCSTRKVAVQEVKKDSVSQIVTKIVTKEVLDVKNETDIVTDEYTITPIDTCKDIVINGKTYRNAVLTYKRTKDSSKYTEKKITSKTEDKKENTKVIEKTKNKKIERKSYNMTWILLIIAIIITLWLNRPTLLNLLRRA